MSDLTIREISVFLTDEAKKGAVSLVQESDR